MLALSRAAPLVGAARSALVQLACGPRVSPLAALLGRGAPGSAATPSSVTAGPVRTLMTKRRRKEIRKGKSASMRELLAFAKQFDPLRTSKLQVKQTFEWLGWEFRMNEVVAEGLSVDVALTDWYCAFDVVEGEHYVLPASASASDDMGLGPGQRPAHNAPGTARITFPSQLGFSSAPPDWFSPVRGLMLDKETAARHAAIRAKGWKLVPIPQPLWEFSAGKAHAAHYSRRDLLMSLTLPLLPFEARAVTSAGAQMTGQAKEATRDRRASSDRASAVEAVRRASLSGRQEDVENMSKDAQAQASAGRSRKARRIAKMKVSAVEQAKGDGGA